MHTLAFKPRRFWLSVLVTTLLILSTQNVLADWISPPPTTVDNTGDVGYYNSLAVVNGNPAISYRDGTNTALKFARATDITGSAWSSITVDNSADVGDSSSLAIVNGKPAISYTNSGVVYDLKYARATDIDGTSWVYTTVDSDEITGINTSLAEVGGKPAISYFDYSVPKTLNYAYADDADGTSWNLIEVIGCGITSCENSLVIVNGNPAISYYDEATDSFMFIRAINADGSDWGTPATPVTIDSSAGVGKHSSLAIINGKPAVSYWDGTNSLKYAYAGDANGSTWNVVTVDNRVSIDVGESTSLADINGKPAISYFDENSNALLYVRALDADGATWGTPVPLDNPNCSGHTSLALVNGNPAISYMSTSSTLKYVRADNPASVTISQAKPARWTNAALLPIALLLGTGMILLRKKR